MLRRAGRRRLRARAGGERRPGGRGRSRPGRWGRGGDALRASGGRAAACGAGVGPRLGGRSLHVPVSRDRVPGAPRGRAGTAAPAPRPRFPPGPGAASGRPREESARAEGPGSGGPARRVLAAGDRDLRVPVEGQRGPCVQVTGTARAALFVPRRNSREAWKGKIVTLGNSRGVLKKQFFLDVHFKILVFPVSLLPL